MTQPPTLNFAQRGDKAAIEHGVEFAPKFDANGLIPAIVTDYVSGEVLMMAWMNTVALSASMTTRQAHFWSRSRDKMWRKGEDSGNVLVIEDMRTDCDQDALLMRVRVQGAGVACHTGARSCFYRQVSLGAADPAGSPLVRTQD
jgi:phosphoribosyl-AMP cyclohydrolase